MTPNECNVRLNPRDTLCTYSSRVGSVVKGPVRTLVNTNFEHMGLSIGPCTLCANQLYIFAF